MIIIAKIRLLAKIQITKDLTSHLNNEYLNSCFRILVIDLAEFIREMAENIHTFGGNPIFSYGHPDNYTKQGTSCIIKLS